MNKPGSFRFYGPFTASCSYPGYPPLDGTALLPKLGLPRMKTSLLINLQTMTLLHLPSYGDKSLTNDASKNIIQPTLDFIHKTGQLG